MDIKTRVLSGVLSLAAMMLLSGCIRDMDPFEGGEGLRVNVNGQKCVMLGMPGNSYATLNIAEDGSSFSTSVSMTSTYIDNYDAMMLDAMFFGGNRPSVLFDLSFNIKDNGAFVQDQKYWVGNGGNTAVMTYVSDETAESPDISLDGWVSFLNLGKVVEARFELEGVSAGGKEFSLRHGFLRLRQKEDKQ